jgi:hypothetical protein
MRLGKFRIFDFHGNKLISSYYEDVTIQKQPTQAEPL